MAEGPNSSEDDLAPEAVEAAKKRSRLNALILAAVFLLSAILPSAYKAFAPFLFVIPIIIAVVNKVRQAGEKPGSPLRDRAYSSRVSVGIPSREPYSHTPKDPKDPRRYKPIG